MKPRNPPDSPTITAVATVKSVAGNTATVEVDADVCPRCAAGEGCGAGLLARGTPTVSMAVPITGSTSLTAGDRVQLGLSPRSLLRGAFCLYGLPLAGLLAGAAIGSQLRVADGIVAAIGLAIGFGVGRWFAQRDPCLSTLRPRLRGVADAEQPVRPDAVS